MAEILIIDDDSLICELLVQFMEKLGHQGSIALTGAQGIELARSGSFDLIFLDVNLPDVNGMDLIQTLKQLPSSPEIIIITGEQEPDGAKLAITSGAWNYLEKPFYRQEINLQVKRALEFRSEKGNVSGYRGLKRNNIIGESEWIKSCLDQVRGAAFSDANAVISGESGTGKGLFARTIHLNSDRSWENFVIADCSAMVPDVAERMLFGTAGGVTDGSAGREADSLGLVEMARNGTLVLDNVDLLPLNVQKLLCRTMEDNILLPVRGKENKKTGFRVIATTREDLDAMMDSGAFKRDFLYRLKGIRIRLPRLKDIPGDITPLAIYYLDRYCKKYRAESKGISPECLEIIQNYHWPGNVRELINAMGKAVASAIHEAAIYSIHLPSHIKADVVRRKLNPGIQGQMRGGIIDGQESLNSFLERKEREYLEQVYSHTNKDVKTACDIAGISRTGFYTRLKKYRIP